MQIEIQGIPQSLKSSYTPRLKGAQAELARWKKFSREAHGKVQRGELLARGGSAFGGPGTSDEPYADDRTRLLVGHEVLEDGARWVYLILCSSSCLLYSCFPVYEVVLLLCSLRPALR
jgi:vesicle transport through interaction with t-SNAREs protein 1